MSEAYKAGVAVGIFVGIIIFVLLLRLLNKDKSMKTIYDEKQEAVRGRGFKLGFYTLIIYNAVITLLSLFDITVPMSLEILMITGILISALVMTSYDVWNDAYMGLNTNAKGFALFASIVSAVNILFAILAVKDGRMIRDGILQSSFLHVLCAVAFVIIGVELFFKSLKDKLEEAED